MGACNSNNKKPTRNTSNVSLRKPAVSSKQLSKGIEKSTFIKDLRNLKKTLFVTIDPKMESLIKEITNEETSLRVLNKETTCKDLINMLGRFQKIDIAFFIYSIICILADKASQICTIKDNDLNEAKVIFIALDKTLFKEFTASIKTAVSKNSYLSMAALEENVEALLECYFVVRLLWKQCMIKNGKPIELVIPTETVKDVSIAGSFVKKEQDTVTDIPESNNNLKNIESNNILKSNEDIIIEVAEEVVEIKEDVEVKEEVVEEVVEVKEEVVEVKEEVVEVKEEVVEVIEEVVEVQKEMTQEEMISDYIKSLTDKVIADMEEKQAQEYAKTFEGKLKISQEALWWNNEENKLSILEYLSLKATAIGKALQSMNSYTSKSANKYDDVCVDEFDCLRGRNETVDSMSKIPKTLAH